MEYFLRYAEQLSNGNEVLILKNFVLSPEKVVNVFGISMIGKKKILVSSLYKCHLSFLLTNCSNVSIIWLRITCIQTN